MKRLFLLLLLAVVSQLVHAKKLKHLLFLPADSLIHKYDTNYFKPLLNHYTIRLYGNVKQVNLQFNSPTEGEHQLIAGNYLKYGGGGGYRWINVNYAYGLDPERRKKSDDLNHFNVQMNVFTRCILYDVRAQYLRGFEQNEIHRGDISMLSLGGSLRYNFNPKKYSFKNSFDQRQWQIKSAGAPIAGINTGYLRIIADSTFYFQGVDTSLVPFHENYNIGLGLGYSYTYVYKKHWFATACFTMYADGQIMGSAQNFTDNPGVVLNLVPETRIAFGYNSDKIFVGVQAMWFNMPGQYTNAIDFNYRYNNIKLIFAHRFHYDPYEKKHE